VPCMRVHRTIMLCICNMAESTGCQVFVNQGPVKSAEARFGRIGKRVRIAAKSGISPGNFSYIQTEMDSRQSVLK
jgi:hypothetical protein